jgi:hypothetical protein
MDGKSPPAADYRDLSRPAASLRTYLRKQSVPAHAVASATARVQIRDGRGIRLILKWLQQCARRSSGPFGRSASVGFSRLF